ncbi:MAG: helix-turn-helix domain-containing protein [Bryobacterales bacterium]|nr:helix-turn-helix domain-containing protein [Bryobacterales bacterium]
MTQATRVFLRFRTVCEKYPVSESKLRKMVFYREIPFHKAGRSLVFDEADIVAYFDAGRVPAREAK